MARSPTWKQALAWRMERQLLDPVGDLSVDATVRRLCAVQAQVASSAELAVAVRRVDGQLGDVAEALAGGRLIKTWAMRGTLHLLTPDDAGAYLAVIAATRPWERPAWKRWAGLTPTVLERFREAVREALADGPATREEIAAALAGRRGLASVRAVMSESWGTILKPLAWLGELCVGPRRNGKPTFQRPETASQRWRSLPGADGAAPRVAAAYLAAYGPAPKQAFVRWMGEGWFSRRSLLACLASLGDRLVPIEIEGEEAHLLADDLESLMATAASRTVRLLPGFDQWVLGPGTADHRVLPAVRRGDVSRQSGWIAPTVVAGGVVSGTWKLDGSVARVTWFREAGRCPRRALEAEVERLASAVGQALDPRITIDG
jgi:hypothetical protein